MTSALLPAGEALDDAALRLDSRSSPPRISATMCSGDSIASRYGARRLFAGSTTQRPGAAAGAAGAAAAGAGEYLERVLGYGPHAARERMRVARGLVKLPQTTAALARGELTYSAVRELTRVATAETEARWLAAAEGRAVNQIERMVAGHQPGDQPEDPTYPDLRPRVVRIELPPEVYALWRQARSVIAAERGAEISDADFVDSLCRGVIAPGTGAEGPTHQIAYQQCPDCRRATQNGAGREIEIRPRSSSARPATPRSWARSTQRRPSARRPR